MRVMEQKAKIQRWGMACAFILSGVWPGGARAAVSLQCDFSNAETRGAPMRYHWEVSNRISPMHRFNMPVGENPYINIVRPLGGKSRDGEKLLDEDTCKWDGAGYVYDWAPLKTQIDTVLTKARIFQLMIDNVPWAFQRGLDFQGGNEVETYGNAWPPNDPSAWSLYIQAMLKELVKTYGLEQVEQWRFCIGREIGTGGHWRGSKLEFFEHYARTVNAIHSVLPDAKVGAHFLWASATNSFGPDFVQWCRQNTVHYDFVGVSYYPFYHKMDRVDIEHVYQVDFAPIKELPEWNPDATLEIHEFALIKSLSKKGNSFDSAPGGHQESFTVMLGKMMFDHDITHVFRWGSGADKLAEQAFLDLKGNVYCTGSKQGEPLVSGNMIDGVFAWDTKSNLFNILVYNYNAIPAAKKDESVELVTTLPFPPSTPMTYRTAVCNGKNMEWSNWKKKRTAFGNGTDSSRLELEIELPSFSFCRLELQGPEPARMKKVLTKRADGLTVEVELDDLKEGNLLCYMRGRRYVIPVALLSDEDQLFLKKWAAEK